MSDIRDLGPSDRSEAIALWQACDLTVPWNDPGDDYDRALANATSRILGAFLDGKLIGTVMTGYEGHRGWLYYVGVDKQHRRSGLAKLLIAEAEDWLKSLGAPKVMLMVRTGNSGAEALYETLGYEASDVTTYGKFFD